LSETDRPNLIKILVVEKEQIPCFVVLVSKPRSSIWRMLDSVIILAPGGRVCYMGPTGEALSVLFQVGVLLYPETIPADFGLDMVPMNPEDSPHVSSQDEARIEQLAVAYFDYYSSDVCTGKKLDNVLLTQMSSCP
jgi:hypothetical protein